MNGRTRLIFTASILLNLILLGAASTMLWRMCGDRYRIGHELSPAGQATLKSAFRDGRAQIGPLIDDAKAHRAEVEKAITADEFDMETYRTAVQPMLESRAGIGRAKAEIMGRALSELSADDRRLIARRMLDRLEGRNGPGRRPDSQTGGETTATGAGTAP